MPQLLLHIGGGVVIHQEHGGVSVPEIVGIAHPEPGSLTSPLHGPLDHALRDPREEVWLGNFPSAMLSFRIFLRWTSSLPTRVSSRSISLFPLFGGPNRPALVRFGHIVLTVPGVQVLQAHCQGFPQAQARHRHDFQDQGIRAQEAWPRRLSEKPSRSCRLKGSGSLRTRFFLDGRIRLSNPWAGLTSGVA